VKFLKKSVSMAQKFGVLVLVDLIDIRLIGFGQEKNKFSFGSDTQK